MNSLEHNGSPQPLFETDDARTYFATTLYIHPDFIPHNEGINEGLNEVINEGINEGIKKLTENGRRIYKLLQADNTVSIAVLSQKSGMSRASVERAMKELKENNLIHREGAKKNGFWMIL